MVYGTAYGKVNIATRLGQVKLKYGHQTRTSLIAVVSVIHQMSL